MSLDAKFNAVTMRAATGVWAGRLWDYLVLAKPRLTSLVLFAVGIGAYLGYPGGADRAFVLLLLRAVLGTALAAAGAMVLNQVMERRLDARMERTRGRPLPLGRVVTVEAIVLGSALLLAGVGCLLWWVNGLASVLALATASSYLFVYGPLKTRTPLATLIGAVPGALPPVIGYAAAAGELDLRAAALFAVLFVWQLPHFLAIAWVHRREYARAGFQAVPVSDPTGMRTAQHILTSTLLLVPASMLPTVVGLAGLRYAIVASVLAIPMLATALCFVQFRTRMLGRAVFIASVTYLPLLLATMATDRL